MAYNDDQTSKLNMSNLIETYNISKTSKESSKKKKLTQHNVFMIKNQFVNNITHSIQLVQKNFLEKDEHNKQMTNSDYQVHELCQNLDFLFLFGLIKPDEAYWKLLLEFTHKNFIKDIEILLNVATNFGKSRAWIYHALNENLMESYLRHISNDKKLISKYYLKDCSIIADDQVISVLITLVSGLENITFKLLNDVPYLDQSCWPTHFNTKRILVDNILKTPIIPNATDISVVKQNVTDIDLKKQIPNNNIKVRRRRRNNVNLDDHSTINKTNNSPIVFNKDKNSTADEEEQDQNEELDASNDQQSEIESDEALSIKQEQEKKIENEIQQLRLENDLIISNKKLKKKLNTNPILIDNYYNSSSCSSFVSNNNTMISNHDLVASSLKASDHFDKKIQDLENYSNIIENATKKIDDCFVDLNTVCDTLDENYTSSNNDDETSIQVVKKQDDSRFSDESKSEFKKEDSNLENSNSDSESDLYSSNNNNNNNNIYQNESNTTTSENLTNDLNLSQIDSENYLTVNNNKTELKQEIKVDSNLKLMLMINIFQNGESEQFLKFYAANRGHSQGEIEKINILISSHGIYILKKNEQNEIDDLKIVKKKTNIIENIYQKDLYLSHTQLDYIEVGLEAQAIHFVCMNKRQSFWMTTGCRILTENLLENIQTARQSNASRLLPVSVFHEATQQRLSLTKFLKTGEKSTDVQINKYQLVFWEDQNSSSNQLIYKDGMLSYFNKSSSSSNLEWKTGYFVLKNNVLAQYRNENDKRPNQIIKLNGEDFLNCRKNNNTSKPNTIELIFSNGNVIYLSAKSEQDAIEWLQIFCRVVSLGSLDTDVPTFSCVPCCSVITANKIYFCHEDLVTGFYRLLEKISLQEINRISFDNDQPYYVVLHDDNENKGKYCFVFFIDENERNIFITGLKEAWELLFQVSLTIEKCKSSELRKRCIRTVNLIQNDLIY